VFFVVLVIAFAVYSGNATKTYRELRTNEFSMTIAYESERVEKIIAEMERNAIDLALAGYHFFEFSDQTDALGESISIKNFSAFPAAVGGGIWFEPYVINDEIKRVCFYAFFDENMGKVRHDPDFQTEEYDYLTQMWYVQIKERLEGRSGTAWTEPYYDDTGTLSHMTTVGSGIYDKSGHFVGMSTVDWRIEDMIERLSSIKPTENSFVLVVSPRDDYILTYTRQDGISYAGFSPDILDWYGEIEFNNDDSVNISTFVLDGIEYTAFSRMLSNGWLFSAEVPTDEIFSEIEEQNNRFTLIFVVLFIAMMVLTIILISQFVNRPIKKLITGVTELGEGNLDKKIEIDSRDEVGMLAQSFNKMTVDLKNSIEQQAREHAEKERMGAELNIARQIQESMLPCIFPPYPDRTEFNIFATMLPAKEVGGDFYDFYLIDEDRLAVVIADVSGKGVPSALFMVITKILIKSNAMQGKPPSEVFETVNTLLCENNETSMFVTAFMGVLDIPSGRFTYTNAGHNPPLIKRKNANYEYLKTKAGFVLGGLEGFTYTQEELTLETGDAVYLYTDGVTEAMDPENRLFTDEKLLDTINMSKETDQQALLEHIKNEIDSFADGAEQADDITMLALTYLGR